jgi:hypothetical protein
MSYQTGEPPRDGKFYKCLATNRPWLEEDLKETFYGMAKYGSITVWGKTLNCWHDKNGKQVEGQIVRYWL